MKKEVNQGIIKIGLKELYDMPMPMYDECFKRIKIIESEKSLSEGVITYYCLSKHFKSVKLGSYLPVYKIGWMKHKRKLTEIT